MRNLLLFATPAVMDTVLFLVQFAVSYGAGERGLNTRQCAWLGGLFQIVYMAVSLAAGFVLSRRNARRVLLASVVLAFLTASAALGTTAYRPLLALMAGFGAASALFFNAFQTFMRGEAPPGGLIRVTAFYTLAWSSGASAGFLVSGSLYRLGGLLLAALVLAATGLIFVLLWRHPARPSDSASADEHAETLAGRAAGAAESYVAVAWVLIFTAMFVQRPIQTFYPALAGRAGVPALLAGAPLFVHMLLQGVAGGAMARARRWLYRPGILAAVQLPAAALFLVLWRWPHPAVAAAGIGLLGAWAGFAYFSAVFYASNAGRRSRNIGVNECLVGLGSFAGLFAAESVMTRLGDDAALYAVCAAALLLSVALQLTLATRRRAGQPALKL